MKMAMKEMNLIPLFEKFIKDSLKGKRLKPDGSRIKAQTIRNYEYVLSYLKEYETFNRELLRIRIIPLQNKKLLLSEKKYWKSFYLGFTGYLYNKKDCFDNYVGSVIKTMRVFFNYLNRELSIPAGEFHKNFYVSKEDIPVITLLPEQLQYLICQKEFEDR